MTPFSSTGFEDVLIGFLSERFPNFHFYLHYRDTMFVGGRIPDEVWVEVSTFDTSSDRQHRVVSICVLPFAETVNDIWNVGLGQRSVIDEFVELAIRDWPENLKGELL